MTTKTIEFTHNSFLKQKPIPAEELSDDNKILQGKGTRYQISEYGRVEDKHQEIKIPIAPDGKVTWWIYIAHMQEVKL